MGELIKLSDVEELDPDNITGKYTLDDDGNPVSEPDLMKWAHWMETEMRKKKRVAETWIGLIWVSTVFLGLDHSYDRSRPPVLWETMIFVGSCSSDCVRYRSMKDAIDGHAKAIRYCKLHFIQLHCKYFYHWVKARLP